MLQASWGTSQLTIKHTLIVRSQHTHTHTEKRARYDINGDKLYLEIPFEKALPPLVLKMRGSERRQIYSSHPDCEDSETGLPIEWIYNSDLHQTWHFTFKHSFNSSMYISNYIGTN